jgi:cytochrome subunit of sulfide dehydrogenase
MTRLPGHDGVMRTLRRKLVGPALASLIGAGSVITAHADAPSAAVTLSDACSGCHGVAGRSTGAIPSLAGIERSRFLTMMKAYRDNSLENTIMSRIARSYSDAEIEAMADFFASSPKR